MRALVLVLLTLTACGSPDAAPTHDDFRGGTCLVLADDLLLLQGYAAQDLIDHPDDPPVDPASAELLRELAGRFREGLAQADARSRAPLTAAVAALDAVNAQVADSSYAGREPLTRVRDSAEALIRACT